MIPALIPAWLLASAAPALADEPVEGLALSVGVHMTGAPRVVWAGEALAGESYAGFFTGVLGEFAYRRFVGRGQLDIALPSTFSGDFSSQLERAGALTGSLGVRLGDHRDPGLSVDLMGTLGGAWLFYNFVDTFGDGSPQFGITVAPRLALNRRIALGLSFRHLGGASVGEGSPITRTDIGATVTIRLFTLAMR